MNVNIANSLSGYIETLYYLNKNFLQLCGIDIIYNVSGDFEKIILDTIRDIPRLIPYSFDKKSNDIICDNNNGLLEYQNDLKYLTNDYNNILRNNHDFLDKVRRIRNKYEHKMHDVKHKGSGSGSTSLFDIEFNVNNEYIRVYATEFMKLIKELNILFSKIVKEIEEWAYKEEKTEYRYYQRISRFDFNDFNKIYDSTLLREIGKVMYQY